jgi:alkaline phosphatase D
MPLRCTRSPAPRANAQPPHLSRRQRLVRRGRAVLHPRARRHGAAPKFSAYPFSLGVASGDPTPDGVVLWTRLAPRPRETGGGMPRAPIEVGWVMAEDEGLGRVVARGTATPRPDWAHAVHVEVDGLRPGSLVLVSVQGRRRGEPQGPHAHAAAGGGGAGAPALRVRLLPEIRDGLLHRLRTYGARGPRSRVPPRRLHLREGRRQRGGPPARHGGDFHPRRLPRPLRRLQNRSRTCRPRTRWRPWIVTWDDHEVSNNYANAIHEAPEKNSPADFLVRRAAAYQAYFEHMPLRRSALPRGPDMLLYRRLEFGRLASFHVLDTRQYRTDQPQGDGLKPPRPVHLDPQARSSASATARMALSRSRAVGRHVERARATGPGGRIDRTGGPEVRSAWTSGAGYEFERRRLLAPLARAEDPQPRRLTGDVHANWANELGARFRRLGRPRSRHGVCRHLDRLGRRRRRGRNTSQALIAEIRS